MKVGQLYKIVYSESDQTKITKGVLVEEDDLTLTLEVQPNKFLTIGKRYLQKATNIIEEYNGT